MIAGLVLALLFILLAIGTPVGFAMGSAGIVGLYFVGGPAMVQGILQTAPLRTLSNYDLIPIPLFLLMAEFVLLSGVADSLFNAAAAWVGGLRGGLGMATTVVGAAFGAMCGTSTASAATLSATTLPAMIKQGYEPRMAAGVVAISGTLAMLIPPAVALIVFGLIAEVSVSKLLVGGILPAVAVMFTIILTVAFLAWRNPERAPAARPTNWREKFGLLAPTWPMLVLFACVLGTIYTGIATVTEASAFGALGGLCVAAYYRRLTPQTFMNALRRATHATCMIVMILIGASIFAYFFTLTQITQSLVHWVGSLHTSPWIIVAIILVGYIILGSFMDQVAILVLTVPVVLPVVVSLGFDPVWFGVIKIVTAEVGMITPPIGLNCFVVSRYSGQPIDDVFKGTFPHFVAHLIVITILVAFPAIVLWLPSRLG